MSNVPPISVTGPAGLDALLLAAVPAPFRIALDTPGQPGSTQSLDVCHAPPAVTVDDGMTLWQWELADGKDRLRVVCRFAPCEAETLVSIEVCHDGPRRVREVTFPHVQHHTTTFDRLLMSSAWGDNIPRPCQSIRAFCDGGGNRTRMGMPYIETRQDEIVYYYPSIMAMQYMVLHNAARSLYMACYSTDDATRTFHAAAEGKYDLALGIRHYPFMHGGTWRSPECALAVLPGGWHAAADLYARHMRPQFRQAQRPEWMAEGFHGWISFMLKREGEAPRYRFTDIPRLYREVVAPTGINVLKLSGWCGAAFDRNYPDYCINPELGTAEELKAACDDVRRMGGRVEFYTNMRLVDPDSEFWRAGGERFVCRDEHGEPYVEEYGTASSFRLACPACPEYADYFISQVRRMITEYGAGAIQVDQTSCNLDYLCFDDRHPHPTPATNYLAGLEDSLRRLREMYRELDPGFYVWGEGCHERFGRAYDVHQGHGEEFTWQLGESTPEQFLYTYPDALVTGHAKTGVQGLCWSHAQGKPFDVSSHNLDDAAFRELLERFVAVRSTLPEYFSRGLFGDNEGVRVAGAARAFAIHRVDGNGILVNLWLPGAGLEQQCSELLQHPRPGWRVTVADPTRARVESNDRWIDVAWTGPVVSLVFTP